MRFPLLCGLEEMVLKDICKITRATNTAQKKQPEPEQSLTGLPTCFIVVIPPTWGYGFA